MATVAYAALALTAATAGAIAAPALDSSAGIIVESSSERAQPGTFRILDGPWERTTAKSRAAGLTPDAGGWCLAGGASGTVVFAPHIADPGPRELFLTWPSSANASDVLVTVTHTGGRAQTRIDQDGWGGRGVSDASRWISLGIYDFDASAEIALTGGAGCRPIDLRAPLLVCADAIRLVPTARRTDDETLAAAGEPARFVRRGRVAWRSSLPAAQEESRRTGAALAVLVDHAHSRTSRSVDQELLTAPDVIAALNAAVPVRVAPGVAPAGWSVVTMPTLLVFEPDGAERGRLIGTISPATLVDLLAP